MPQPISLALAAAVAVAGVLMGWPVEGRTPAPEAVANLSGRWAGQGQVVLQRGPAESFKCVVTYFPQGDGSRLQQNLRCSNDSYKLDAATHLVFSGTTVSGRWEDKVHNLEGNVTGVLKPGGFDVELAGRFFHATMAVAGDACAQSVKVQPLRGSDNIREISAALRKC